MISIKCLYVTMVIGIFSSCSNQTNSVEIEKIAKYIQSTGIELSKKDYLDAGIHGITTENLNKINAKIASLVKKDRDTKIELQNIIIREIAIEKIIAYTKNHGEKLTIQDYLDVGIKGVTVENLVHINATVAVFRYKDKDIKTELQAMILKEIAIDKIAAYAQNRGEILTLQDYIDAGIRGVTIENLSQMNATVEGLRYYRSRTSI